MNPEKTCSKCHEIKPLSEFHNQKAGKYGKTSYCKKCISEYSKEYNQKHKNKRTNQNKMWYENGGGREKQSHISMYENKSCPSYLGVVIGERLCRYLFKDVKAMPYGFSGYDFICNRDKKINIKTACITFTANNPRWKFHIKRNKIPDFFILVAFDNLTDLSPLHIWMIPGSEINNNSSKSISPSRIHKWDKWERSIEEVQMCCTEMKNKGE